MHGIEKGRAGRHLTALKRIFTGLPALIFPPRCASCKSFLELPASHLMCRKCRSEITPLSGPRCKCCGMPFDSTKGVDHVCAACIRKRPPFKRADSLFVFEESVRNLIHRFKYHSDMPALRALVSISEKTLQDLLPEKEAGDAGSWVVLPVPLHKSRLRKRGFNHAAVLATRLFRDARIDYSLLRKTRKTPSQTGLSLKDREQNIRGSFSCRTLRRGCRQVLIFDDVFTTGATASAAALAVKKAGAEDIRVITIARTPLP